MHQMNQEYIDFLISFGCVSLDQVLHRTGLYLGMQGVNGELALIPIDRVIRKDEEAYYSKLLGII
jgi:hypothetical protein